MEGQITDTCIIEEYLNNWFTYEELSQYLCVSLEKVKSVLDNHELISNLCGNKKVKKIIKHKSHIENFDLREIEKKIVTDFDFKVIEIAKYIIENKCSVREAALRFEMGKTTIHDYMTEKLPGISLELYKQVFEVLMENKSFDTNNKEVIRQVLLSYELLNAGLTSVQIQEKLGISRNVLQRNLTTRLRKIDEDKYNQAIEILKQYQKQPLEEHAFKSKK